jgi:hypothetical protein
MVQFFNKEIIRYACGCLNARKNGTIMFGIGDSCGTTDGVSKYCHGEVVGIPIEGMQGDFRAEITMLLRTAITTEWQPFAIKLSGTNLNSKH